MHNLFLCLIIFNYFVFVVTLNKCNQTQRNELNCDKNVLKNGESITWNDFMSRAQTATNNFLPIVQYALNKTIPSSDISEVCSTSLSLYLEGIRQWKPWAIQMADSNGRIPSGLLTGTQMDFGNFEECLRAKTKHFKGQYCLVGLQTDLLQDLHSTTPNGLPYNNTYGYPPDWIASVFEAKNLLKTSGVYVGTCIPSSCSPKEVQRIISTLFHPWITRVSLSDCQTNDPKQLTNSAILSKYALWCLAVICLLGTILDKQEKLGSYETKVPLHKSRLRKLLQCFSLSDNVTALLDTSEKDASLKSLNGFRFLLSMWVVMCHVMIFPDKWKHMKHTSYYSLIELSRGWTTTYVENGYLSVESFYVMSGILTENTMKRVFEKNGGKVDLVDFLIQKYFRILPLIIFLLAVLTTMPAVGSGPIWNSTWEHEMEKCWEYAWHSLFFIQNFNDIRKVCFVHLWFLANLLQCLLLGIFVMVLMLRSLKVGILVGIAFTVLCICHNFTVVYMNKFPILKFGIMKDIDTFLDYGTHVYMSPFNHAPSVLIGIALSRFMQTKRNIQLSKNVVQIGWCLSIFTTFFIIFAFHLPVTNNTIISLYFALRNIFWSLSFSWMVFACAKGYGGVVNAFLSSNFFMILGRLCFCIYMFHPLVLLYRAASLRERMPMKEFDHVFEFHAVFLISCFCSFFGFIAVEMPFVKIYNTFFKKTSTSYYEEKTISADAVHTAEKIKQT